MQTRRSRVRLMVPWTCLLLAAAVLCGCGAPQFSYATDSSAGAYFKVPHGWHEIDTASLTAQMNALSNGFGNQPGLWETGFDASSEPSAAHVLDPSATSPFAFSFVVPLSTKASNALSYDLLRNFILPVTPDVRKQAIKGGFPIKAFSLLGDSVIHDPQGVHGIRETFEYTYNDGHTATFDQIALTNADATEVYLLIVHCQSACYDANASAINTVMTSFTVRSR